MPTESQQLIVRRHAPGRTALLAAIALVGALVLLAAAFEAGQWRAGYSALSAEVEKHEREAENAALKTQLATSQAKLAAADMARRVDRESSAQVEKSLTDMETRLAEQSQELTFYRGIVNPSDGIAGLKVQRVQVLPGVAPHRYRVRIVLIQAARQDATTSASADLSIDGMRAGRAVNLPLAEIGTSPKALTFSFRFFQELETEIQLPPDFVPQRVQIEVRPARATAPIRATFPWKIDTN
jgi:hypothetical protein